SLYSAGGYSNGPTNGFYRYDPSTNSWTTLASLPGSLYDARSVYDPATNKVYVFGGIDASFTVSNTTYVYDVATDSWTTGATMPGGRYFPAVGYYGGDGKIYVAGGFDPSFTETTTTWQYDPVADTWNTSLAPIPVAMGGSGATVSGHDLYLMGTWNGGLGSTLNYHYDITPDTRTAGAPVPVSLYDPGAGALNGKVYLVGGGDPYGPNALVGKRASARALASPNSTYGTTYAYDTATDTWQNGPNLNTPRSFTAAGVTGNHLVAVGGYDGV